MSSGEKRAAPVSSDRTQQIKNSIFTRVKIHSRRTGMGRVSRQAMRVGFLPMSKWPKGKGRHGVYLERVDTVSSLVQIVPER